MTSRWGPSPTSVCWTSTSTSKRRRKVRVDLVAGLGGFQGTANPFIVSWIPPARKESAKEKQLKEEEKILESVAEGRGEWELCFRSVSSAPRIAGELFPALGMLILRGGTGGDNGSPQLALPGLAETWL